MISLLSIQNFARELVRSVPELLLRSRKENNANKFGISRGIYKKQLWRILRCIGKTNFSLTKDKAIWPTSRKNFTVLIKLTVFIFPVTIKTRVIKKSFPLSITHIDDFRKYFLDNNLLPPKRCLNKLQSFLSLSTLLLSFTALQFTYLENLNFFRVFYY